MSVQSSAFMRRQGKVKLTDPSRVALDCFEGLLSELIRMEIEPAAARPLDTLSFGVEVGEYELNSNEPLLRIARGRSRCQQNRGEVDGTEN